MNYNDYYLDYFTYQITNKDAQYQEGDNKFTTTSPTYTDNETITFYAKFNGGEDWVQIGTYNLETKEITPNDTYVQEMTTSKITFKEGVHCTGWRFTTTNKHYYTYITVTPYFVLTNSDYVKEKIANKDSIKIQNNVSTNITDYKGNTIFEKETSAMDYARVTYYDSDITKKVSSVSNNVVGRKYTITWKVNAWETATSGSGKAEYIRQDSGKFYDVIPLGGEPDVNSIQVETEEGFLEANEYTYEVIANYNNSGRAMLVVNINKQAKYYTLYYKTVHSWESMIDYGKNVLNPVAYETGNEKITNGYADNGGNLSSENKELFTNLDNETDSEKFIYTERTYNINAVTSAVSGLYKKVKNSKDTEYSYNTEVEPNGSYSYQLRYQNSYINKAESLILFDSLENFEVINTETGETKTSGWKGLLQSVDLTQLKRKGIDAILYVSTVENLDLENHNDITDTSIWTKATIFTDLSTATAIAIDMTKNTFGNDYILDEGESITAVLHMKAPEEVTDEIEENPYTYNNVYIKNTLIDDLEGTEDYFIHQDYTTVKYHIIADVPFYKVSSENEDCGIKGITFRLYGTSNYGTEVDEYVTSDKNGLVNFKDIEAGEYILQEYEATPDWLEDHTEHTVEVTNKKKVYIDGQLVTNLIPIKIKNTPRIHTDVTFYKKDLVDKNKVLEGVKFKLEGTSDYGNEILMYVESDSDGKVTFEDVEKGTYTLVEVNTIEGYILNGIEYKVIVDENGNFDIQKPVQNIISKTETVPKTITKYSHTSNINDEGIASSDYVSNLAVTDTVTIEGAESLNVTVYYSTESTSYDWVCVYDESVTPSASNYSSSISGKLGGNSKTYSEVNSSGYQTACSKWTGTITGDTVKFFFRSDGSVSKYGYYAIITATVQEEVMVEETVEGYESIYDNGNYCIYNEPYHSFYFTKKDAYNYEKLGGAKFKLYGCSNTGNTYSETVTSVEGTGYVTFENLESGTYVLREIQAPNTDNVTYVLDQTPHIVEVYETGKVALDGKAIWPLSEINNEPYIFSNTRNKGQIIITKKWVDNLSNEEREEPVIYISTKKPEQSYPKAYFRTASSSSSIIDYVTTTENVTSFKRNTTLSEAQVLEKSGVTRLDNDYNNENTEYKIYAWVENGTLYWWTKADYGVLPANLDYYFNNESSLKDIDWTGIYQNGYWNSTTSQKLTESITNMKYMFYNCSSIENLNISWFNNTQITTAVNMRYAFGNNSSSTVAGTMSSLKYITIGENFKLFNTSVLTKGSWKNQATEAQYVNISLIGTITPGTYEYMGIAVKYAVQIYGIRQDEDASGNKLGLTFGPATGANYNNAYVTHTYEANSSGTYNVVIVTHNVSSDGSETTSTAYLTDSSGNTVTRTEEEKNKYDINIHDMTWAEISEQSQADPTVFKDAMLCGDTKSVQINLNSTLASGATQTAYGDGAGVLHNTVNSYYRKWNPSSSDNSAATNGGSYGSNAQTAGGYSSSHIRATLIGENSNTDVTYAGDVNLTESTSLYSCIESDLRNVITAKKVKYVTGSSISSYSQNTVYDKIWLFSEREVYSTGEYSGNTTEGLGNSGVGYDKFVNSESKYYMSSYSANSTTNRVAYTEAGSASNWWLRSPYFYNTGQARLVVTNGAISSTNAYNYWDFNDLSLGFCIK